jgi:hypothetical protein
MRVTPAEAPGGVRETSFEALELEGCEGGMGVAGRAVVTQLLRAEGAPAASMAHATLIEPMDDLQTDHETPEWDGVVRALEFPDQNLAVVFGQNTWIVRGDTVVLPRGCGFINAIVFAGDQVLFWCNTESNDWITSLERAAPPRRDGSARYHCLVADPSGTPLNVHAERGARTAVVGTLPNGSRVDVRNFLDAWARIESHADGDPRDEIRGWVLHRMLNCN